MQMKALYKYLFLLLAPALAACSGNVDDSDLPLHIQADKTAVAADGQDAVTFTVTYGIEDVSASGNMILSWEKDGASKSMKASENTFTTNDPGKYVFSAEYKDGPKIIRSSETVTIEATVKEGPSSGFYHKMLAMEFTSVWCTYCPALALSVSKIESDYPGRIIPVAFHSDRMGEDRMTLELNDRIYEKVQTGDGGLPMFAFDFRKSSQHIVNEYDKIADELQKNLREYESVCGVAIESTFDNASRKLDVTASFKSDVQEAFRYHIFLIEDGIEEAQAGAEGAYVHNNVLRAIAADNIFGAKVNQGELLKPGQEYEASRSFVIDENWNEKEMKVVVCILRDFDGSYACDNSNVCQLGESAGYLYEE